MPDGSNNIRDIIWNISLNVISMLNYLLITLFYHLLMTLFYYQLKLWFESYKRKSIYVMAIYFQNGGVNNIPSLW